MDQLKVNVYADATTLIGLARIDRLDLLRMLVTPILVTQQVWNEVVQGPSRPGVAELVRARAENLLLVVDEGDGSAYPRLDEGESTVLSAAVEAGGAVLIDEKRARRLLATNSVLRGAIAWQSGLLGVLLLAKQRGLVTDVRPILEQLMSQGFRVSSELARTVLHNAGESPSNTDKMG